MEKEAAFFGVRDIVEEGREASGRITDQRSFDLYYIGAIVGEELGAVRPGDVMGEVEDFEVFEKLAHGCEGNLAE